MASALYPSAARRGGIERMWSVKPRFSWITRTEPLGFSAPANTPISSPCGPANRISSPCRVGRTAGVGAAAGAVSVDVLECSQMTLVSCR